MIINDFRDMKLGYVFCMFAIVFVCCGNIYAQENNRLQDGKGDENKTVKRLRINNSAYEVMPYDLKINGIGNEFTCEMAIDTCRELVAFGKDDWFLPRLSELEVLYEYRDEIGGFDGYYWSSWEETGSPARAWLMNFRDGDRFCPNNCYFMANVRCVRKDIR